MPSDSYVRAPRWRQTGSGLLDAGVLTGVRWLARRGGLIGAEKLITRIAGPGQHVLREQFRSPGQLLFGTRSVDRRTGARVALWRSLAIVVATTVSGEITRRLTVTETPELARRRQAHAVEGHEIFRRHPQDSPEREAALQELSARYPRGTLGPSAIRVFGPPLLSGLVLLRLRRRLAPTVEVLARGSRGHRP